MVLKHFVGDLKTHEVIKNVYLAHENKYVDVYLELTLVTADMPQRADFAAAKSHKGFRPCGVCVVDETQLDDTETEKELRTRQLTEEQRSKIAAIRTKTEKRAAASLFGLRLDSSPLESLPYFDVHRDIVLDIFHLEPIGLMRHHFGLIRGPPSKAKDEVLSDRLMLISTSHSLDLIHKWPAAEWYKLATNQYSHGLFKDIATPEEEEVWRSHLQLIRQLFAEEMTLNQAQHLQAAYQHWRQQMKVLYPSQLNFPNFHGNLSIAFSSKYLYFLFFPEACTHILYFFKRFGPVRLYSCEPFERYDMFAFLAVFSLSRIVANTPRSRSTSALVALVSRLLI
jgi:hypothetical protein